MKSHMFKYITTTFLFSWFFWILVAVAGKIGIYWMSYDSILGKIFYVIGGLAPTICEVWLQRKSISNKKEFRKYLKTIVNIKQAKILYVYAIGGAVAIFGIPVFFGFGTWKSPFYIGVLLILPMILGGGLEEIGWRGFLQPELEKKLSHWKATLLVSIIWAFWHLPLWWIDGTNQSNMNFGWFCLYAITLSLFIGSVYFVSKSIFMAILAHAAINGFGEVCQVIDRIFPTICILIVVACITLFIDGYVQKMRIHAK